jgi:hydroxymethylglutaryl-CoA reductase (NADPH)
MDLRTLPDGLSPEERCDERRKRVEEELGTPLDALTTRPGSVGHADEKNCEQMIGHVPMPLGYAGPLSVTMSSGQKIDLHLPLATTEGALVASVNRGCKAVTACGGAVTSSIHHGISRSIAFVSKNPDETIAFLKKREADWKAIAESTSGHLKVLRFDLDVSDAYIFLTLFCDTDEAMGMNMVTIAAQSVGEWVEKNSDTTFVTVAGNVDSDKKPSARVHDRGRGYEVTAEVTLSADVIRDVLKTTPESMLAVGDAKLKHGSAIAGALGQNLHAANIIAALYLATGQDAAHVVEGSLTQTSVISVNDGVKISVRCPAIIVGVRGGGTTLPAQSQCLQMLLGKLERPFAGAMHPKAQLAESIGAAVLAGEVSLLAAQASHTLASAHRQLGRKNS